jgi:hypothetical protein
MHDFVLLKWLFVFKILYRKVVEIAGNRVAVFSHMEPLNTTDELSKVEKTPLNTEG